MLLWGGVRAQPTPPFQRSHDDSFELFTASPADDSARQEIFFLSQQAKTDLQAAGYALPKNVKLYVYPTLASYQAATRQPWFVAATAEPAGATLHLQRARVLLERHSLATTLRHELFHLVQPKAWPRWKAEGYAMRFAGETPTASPIAHISPDALNNLLRQPPDRGALERAVATAFFWTTAKRSSAP